MFVEDVQIAIQNRTTPTTCKTRSLAQLLLFYLDNDWNFWWFNSYKEFKKCVNKSLVKSVNEVKNLTVKSVRGFSIASFMDWKLIKARFSAACMFWRAFWN